jgi:hypothetical protein
MLRRPPGVERRPDPDELMTTACLFFTKIGKNESVVDPLRRAAAFF